MYLLAGDDYACDPYHGMYQGSNLFLACAGTDKAALFLTTVYNLAYEYAAANEGALQRVSVLSLCHDRVVAMFGA